MGFKPSTFSLPGNGSMPLYHPVAQGVLMYHKVTECYFKVKGDSENELRTRSHLLNIGDGKSGPSLLTCSGLIADYTVYIYIYFFLIFS